MPYKKSEIDREFIEFYNEISRKQGFSDECLTKMFALLYLETEEISMDELAKKTGYSLASICNKLKLLEAAGFVNRIKKPGTKKIYLCAEKDMLNVWKKAVVMKQEVVIRLAKEKLPAMIQKYKSKKLTEKEKTKLKLLQSYYEQMMKIDSVLKETMKEIKRLRQEI